MKLRQAFKWFICRLLRRHRSEVMKKAGAKFHQFNGHNGGGFMCKCPKCGTRVYKGKNE